MPPTYPAAGLVYNTAEGLWGIDVSGTPRLLLDQPDARISPDGSQAAYTLSDDVWLVNLTTGKQTNLSNTPNRLEWTPMWWLNGPGVLIFGSDTEKSMGNLGYPTAFGLDGSGYQVLDPEEGGPNRCSIGPNVPPSTD